MSPDNLELAVMKEEAEYISRLEKRLAELHEMNQEMSKNLRKHLNRVACFHERLSGFVSCMPVARESGRLEEELSHLKNESTYKRSAIGGVKWGISQNRRRWHKRPISVLQRVLCQIVTFPTRICLFRPTATFDDCLTKHLPDRRSKVEGDDCSV